MPRKPRTTDTISFRCPPDLDQALDAFVSVTSGATQSGVVIEALRQFLGVPEPGTISRGEWEGMVEHVSDLSDRLDASDALVAQLARRLAVLERGNPGALDESGVSQDALPGESPAEPEPRVKLRPANW